RLNRSFQAAVSAAKIEGQPWKSALEPFLFAYRNTTHPATGRSPAEIIFNRKINDGLPIVNNRRAADDYLRQRDRHYKAKYQQTAPNRIRVGDRVLVRRVIGPKKLNPLYSPTPHRVVAKQGRMVTVQHPDGHNVVRHESHFKIL